MGGVTRLGHPRSGWVSQANLDPTQAGSGYKTQPGYPNPSNSLPTAQGETDQDLQEHLCQVYHTVSQIGMLLGQPVGDHRADRALHLAR